MTRKGFFVSSAYENTIELAPASHKPFFFEKGLVFMKCKKSFFMREGIFFIFTFINSITYGTYNKYELNIQGKALLTDCFGEGSELTNVQILDILSIQDRIYRDIQTDRWKIQGKKKHGGHLEIDTFRNKILQKI